MHVYKKILTLMLLSGAAIASEGDSSEKKGHSHLGLPRVLLLHLCDLHFLQWIMIPR